MNPFTWNDRYSLGQPEIDTEHQALFRLAEQLYDAVSSGTATDQFEGLLARLASYARFHFEDEEGLMRHIGYPELAQHQQEHRAFLAQLSMLENMFRSGSPDLDNAMLEFLGSWLEQHIGGSDQHVARYMKTNKVAVGSNRAKKGRPAQGARRHQSIVEEQHLHTAAK